ncbi:pentatricopeptide repeat-containing protein at1g09190 [Phtheirospermum japonicum]|uniref:Pentatricopeptide repeat-containing protein at1g09190 n=1 Tax=Phtheirospermum japonicum TaxID=374723 RepID=A0A830C0V2_9LAMI|nr:pentatricopeptide repeat-containing protein at1g09190 [Phtheirospermum japonicum]
MFPQISNVVGIVKTTDEPMDLDNLGPEYDWKQKLPGKEHVVYGPLLGGLTKPEICVVVCRASQIRCDPVRDPDENIVNILSPVDRSVCKTSCETRLYEVQPSTWVITHLEVEHALPVISSVKAVRVRVGYNQRELPNESFMDLHFICVSYCAGKKLPSM